MNTQKYTGNETPLVSIVTIVLNGEKHIRDTINSVLNQDYPNVEYIIIDGGSTDNTLNIIKEYGDKIDIWYSEPDNGIADAFNKGISLAKGELIGMINADDWYEPDAVSTVVSAYKKENFDASCAEMAIIREEDTRYYIPSIKDLKEGMSILHPTMFVRRKVYEDIGGFDSTYRIAMDYDFCLRLQIAGKRIYKIDKHLVNMRTGGISIKMEALGLKESLWIKNKYFGIRIQHYVFYFNKLLKEKMVSFLKKRKLKSTLSVLRKIYYLFHEDVAYKK